MSLASDQKVAWHREKLAAYLRGERIFPVTLELDITSKCTRVCPDCPSCRSSFQKSLPMDFIERLLHSFQGQTKGLLLTGGEPTMSPDFRRVLALARLAGFEEIAVVTNGSLLDRDSVAEALMEHASTIRVSMYDWDGGSCSGIRPTLERIAELRRRIDRAESALRIGISALTSKERASRLPEVTEAVRAAGAHWIYFHPLCYGWSDSHLAQEEQDGVLQAIAACRQTSRNGFSVYVSASRYQPSELSFTAYHAAHFLVVIGADGVNYVGAEVKYQPRFALADVAGDWSDDFLHRPERLARIRSVTSQTYTALRSRHRGVLYNHLVEKIAQGAVDLDGIQDGLVGTSFPHIL